MLVLECGLNALKLDEVAYPDMDDRYIYEHLKYYCSKSTWRLPAVAISIERLPPVIVAGHKYFRIARELGVKSIRAIVERDDLRDKVQELLLRPDVQVLDLKILRQEEDTLVQEGCHIFFFERPLDSRAKTAFEARMAGFFRSVNSSLLAGRERKVSPAIFSCGDRCAEFTAVTPLDHGTCRLWLDAAIEFSTNVAKIISYQGGKFGW